MLRYTISINEACPSVSTIPIPSAQRLKLVSNLDLWEYNPEELVRFTPLRRFSSTVYSSANISAVWSHFHAYTSKAYADKAWCDYCHRPNTPLCLDTLNGITRMNNNVHVCSSLRNTVKEE